MNLYHDTYLKISSIKSSSGKKRTRINPEKNTNNILLYNLLWCHKTFSQYHFNIIIIKFAFYRCKWCVFARWFVRPCVCATVCTYQTRTRCVCLHALILWLLLNAHANQITIPRNHCTIAVRLVNILYAYTFYFYWQNDGQMLHSHDLLAKNLCASRKCSAT